MSKSRMFLVYLVSGTLAFGLMILSKWYITTTRSEISTTQGVYGTAGLETWIEINSRLPGPMRRWACDTLRAREKVALGGQNSMPPHGCQPDFVAGPGSADDRIAQMTDAFGRNAALQAQVRGGTTAQQAQVHECVKAALDSGLSAPERAAMSEPGHSVAEIQAAQEGMGQKFSDASAGCIAQAGL